MPYKPKKYVEPHICILLKYQRVHKVLAKYGVEFSLSLSFRQTHVPSGGTRYG